MSKRILSLLPYLGYLFGVLFIAAFVVSGSVSRCSAVHGQVFEGPSPEDEADKLLDEEVRDLRRDYSETTEEALGVIGSNVWCASTGAVVAPTKRAFHIRSKDSDIWEAYAVRASTKTRMEIEGRGADVWTLCVETAEWCDLVTLTIGDAPADGSTPPGATLKSPSILGGATLTLVPEMKEMVIEGPDEAILAARGTTRDKVESAVAAWCATHAPSAQVATWDEIVEEDHRERVWRMGYKLDDKRGTPITLSIAMDTGKLEVEEGGR